MGYLEEVIELENERDLENLERELDNVINVYTKKNFFFLEAYIVNMKELHCFFSPTL